MKHRSALSLLVSGCLAYCCHLFAPIPAARGADKIESKTTYAKAYGETKGAVTVDPAKDLPRYPYVQAKDAIATFQVKKGFALEFAAHEPEVRSPIALSFDERGRMFVCEMIDYSEMRDANPHLGRISVLEDLNGDGYFEHSRVFADNLPWPTGLICANGGVYVVATPDIIFFKDTDGDGKSDVRETVFTGFGTGLKIINVQGMANCPQWGLDGRIHVQAGGGNRGKVKCLKRPELPEVELGGRDFWFDPRTHEFGLEAGGGQFGMSFDDYGNRFVCSNSDHLQAFIYDDRYVARNPYATMPPVRQSIAVDGGAAEVFRISPDEPWRIIRTRWRVAGVVKGMVEGGGRVSGYFTGATGTTVYRGDAYGPDFVGNTFTGDAGGQLIHRKVIHTKGASFTGRRPEDEHGFEFIASRDTWVRMVNFANAPDGCLYACDMYREVIEHPWSIPDEIKKHIDLNSGNDRGRVYRITPKRSDWQRRTGNAAMVHGKLLGDMTAAELVNTLAHPNGWHRDCASRLLYERYQGDSGVVMLLEELARDSKSPHGRLHAMCALRGFNALTSKVVLPRLKDQSPRVREHAVRLCEYLLKGGALSNDDAVAALGPLATDADPRVILQLAFTLGGLQSPAKMDVVGGVLRDDLSYAMLAIADRYADDPLISAAILSASRLPANPYWLYGPLKQMRPKPGASLPALQKELVRMAAAASKEAKPGTVHGNEVQSIIDSIAASPQKTTLIRAFAEGLKRAGVPLESVDVRGKLAGAFTAASAMVKTGAAWDRLEAIALLETAPFAQGGPALLGCLGKGQSEPVQVAAVKALGTWPDKAITLALLEHWGEFTPTVRQAALTVLLARPERTQALLESMTADSGAGAGITPTDLSASQVQALLKHQDKAIAALAQKALASVIPPSRESVIAKFQPALTAKGDVTRGQLVFTQRCLACHRAAGMGLQVGPDLVTVKTKGRDALLTAILDPNKEVAPQFIAYTVTTKDGQTLSGVIARDDASSLGVMMMGGAQVAVPRANIKGTSSTAQSLMPEGLETGMTVQDMADLLEFIEGLK